MQDIAKRCRSNNASGVSVVGGPLAPHKRVLVWLCVIHKRGQKRVQVPPPWAGPADTTPLCPLPFWLKPTETCQIVKHVQSTCIAQLSAYRAVPPFDTVWLAVGSACRHHTRCCDLHLDVSPSPTSIDWEYDPLTVGCSRPHRGQLWSQLTLSSPGLPTFKVSRRGQALPAQRKQPCAQLLEPRQQRRSGR